MSETGKRERILQLMQRQGGLARPRDLDAIGVSREYLNKLYLQGELDRPGRGLYALPDRQWDENQSLVEACRLVPAGVLCLLTALRHYDMTSESPFEVWLAIDGKQRQPRLDFHSVRIVRFSGEALSFGVREERIGGVSLPIYSPAKTVADCFKFRNKIGLDVALGALRDCVRQKRATMDELWQAAKVCRMTNVMRPYLEAVV